MLYIILLASIVLIMSAGIKISMWMTENITQALITQRFQDAEFIMHNHKAPNLWTTGRHMYVDFLQGTLPSRLHVWLLGIFSGQANEKRQKDYLLKCLDAMTGYFEKCPFFQDEESRNVLISGLQNERANWVNKPINQIINQNYPTNPTDSRS